MTLDPISDKEKLVMKLLKEDKNYPEIAKEARVSFTFISKVNKKRLGENTSVKKQLSIPTQALKLFSEGKSVLDVIIILDRPPQEILEIYDDYLQLINLDEIASLIDFNQEYLSTITKLINYVIQNSVSTNDLLTTFELVKDLPRLKSMKKQLENKIKVLRQEKDYLSGEYNNSGE